MSRTSRHHKSGKKKYILIAVLLAVVALTTGYGVNASNYSDRFLPNTKINHTDISNLTVSEANKKLQEATAQTNFTITDNGTEWKKVSLADLGMKTDFSKELDNLLGDQNQWGWGMAYVFTSNSSDVNGLTLDEAQLDAAAANIQTELNTLNESRTKTADATLTKGPTGFTITPEVNGNSVNVDQVIKDLKAFVAKDQFTLDLMDYTEKPTVLSTDATLQEQMNQLNQIAQIQANYTINGETFQIPTETISGWLTYTDGKVSLDREQVKAYVTSLGERYNTSTNATKFNSTKRGEVSVPAGTYSWTIQPDSETDALMEAILAGAPFTRTPITAGSAAADTPLIGNTYIEVDLQNQHMWYYKDGAVALETDVVTGKPKSATPPGVNYIWEKKTNETLKGKNDDGTDYASPVAYWLPIDWTGVGIHDSDWQPAYGGDLYLTNGSHGCVNTPPDVMKTLYEAVEVGTPVLVF
ncbi:L,D-transpeptidase family protein [Enterococcus asini]|uniref:L,D-transpeptidase family protein n=1 Tax=Enterococcus asini TaxID=57732 RepID=UPI0028919631|nr:L,D-transpeptidase family protein [Enterococcus asini]MDT2757569.1 L,D-transpeptidase family protein [Enterococcus asini]